MRFLHAADLHIDSPLRGLERYEGAPVERVRTATRRALEALVERAGAERVDFVLLAGDLFDSEWQDVHTGLFFAEQMRRLERSGIRVFIVLGNHDAQGVIARHLSLPANVKVFASGSAETVHIAELGVAVHGRSFPNRPVDEDLVPTYPAPVAGCFNIGLLHTSLDGRPGHDTYAPTARTALQQHGYEYWALGHVHAREVVSEAQPRIVYPGNTQGRNALETGAKGGELVNVRGGIIESEFVALDAVRWNHLPLVLDGSERLETLGDHFRAALAPLLRGATDRLHALRVTVSGESELDRVEARNPGALAAALQAAAQDVSEAEVWVEQVRVQLATAYDRAQAAERDDAVGELTRLVDAIAAEDREMARWVQAELAELWKAIPAEVVNAGDVPDLDDPQHLRTLLLDAEATVRARLAPEDGQ